jgi:hypothetical protein
MKAKHSPDMDLPVRFAPYLACVALAVLVFSLHWDTLRPVILLPAILSGAVGFIFSFLRWRTGRDAFHMFAWVFAMVPYFLVSDRHHLGWAQWFQYLAAFFVSYYGAIVIFRTVLRKMKIDDPACNS